MLIARHLSNMFDGIDGIDLFWFLVTAVSQEHVLMWLSCKLSVGPTGILVVYLFVLSTRYVPNHG